MLYIWLEEDDHTTVELVIVYGGTIQYRCLLRVFLFDEYAP